MHVFCETTKKSKIRFAVAAEACRRMKTLCILAFAGFTSVCRYASQPSSFCKLPNNI